jgi:thiol-disulfide isomerase/thioredoxin
MNIPLLGRVGSVALVMLGVAACTPPKKDDQPPKPKVTVDAAKPAAAPATTAALSLPMIGPAPAWKLQDLSGKVVSSDEFKGKVVVLDFWATWCGPCRMEIPGYVELVKKYGKDGFTVVGVSIDQAGPDVVKQFVAKNGVNYPMVMADEKVAADFGGVEAIPTTFLIDRAGQIRDRKVGAEETAEYEKKIVSLLN